MKKYLLPTVILFSAFLLFSYRITSVPPGINGDEASIGYNAILVSRTLRVEAGNRLPLFIPTFNPPDWKQPVTFYATAIAFKIFGPSYSLLRGVSVFFALLSMLLIFMVVRELLGVVAGTVSMVLFALTPIVLIQSHLALENIAPVPFVLFWILLLLKYIKSKNPRYMVFAGAALGAGIFSYNGMRLIVPVLGLLTLLYLKKWRPILAFILGISPFLLILLWANGRYPGAVLANNRPFWVDSYQQFFLPYISSFDPSFLFLKGDATAYHSTGRAGMFLLASAPLFILGVIRAIKEKSSIYRFLLACFFASPILYGFVGESYRASRLLAIIPFYVLISTLGFTYLMLIKNKNVKSLLLAGLFTLLIANYLNFANDYWYSYQDRVKKVFSTPVHTVFAVLNERQKEGYKIYAIKDFIGGREEIKFFRAVYPLEMTEWEKGDEILPKSALLTYPDLLSAKQKDTLKEIYTNDFSQSIFLKE